MLSAGKLSLAKNHQSKFTHKLNSIHSPVNKMITKQDIESLILDYTEKVAHYKQINYLEGRLHAEEILSRLYIMKQSA